MPSNFLGFFKSDTPFSILTQFLLHGAAFSGLHVLTDHHTIRSRQQGYVFSYREIEAIFIYGRCIGMVSFWGTDETDRRSEGIYFHQR
jgi:hypothetical protein